MTGTDTVISGIGQSAVGRRLGGDIGDGDGGRHTWRAVGVEGEKHVRAWEGDPGIGGDGQLVGVATRGHDRQRNASLIIVHCVGHHSVTQ